MSTDSALRAWFPAIFNVGRESAFAALFNVGRESAFAALFNVGRESAFAALFTAALVVAAAPSEAAGPDCARATEELTRAQQALSKAIRDADTVAAAYAACMEGGKACASQKSAYDAALAAKAKAVAGHKAASSRRQDACQ